MTREDKSLLFKVGLFAAGYFIVLKPILEGLGLKPTENEIEDNKKKDAAQKDFYNNATGGLSKTLSEWQMIANVIYEDLRYSSLDDNKADAGYQVSRVQTEKDLAALIKAFGFKQEYAFGLPIGGLKDLPTFIRTNLSKSAIDKINWNYRSKKIKFQY